MNFDDGVVFKFKEKARPRHLQFYCKQSKEGEGCDVRLAKQIETNFSWPEPSTEPKPAVVDEVID